MNQQQFWHYFKLAVRDYIYFFVFYAALYYCWCLLSKGRIIFIDKYDAYFFIAATLCVLPLIAYGKYTCDEWLKKHSGS